MRWIFAGSEFKSGAATADHGSSAARSRRCDNLTAGTVTIGHNLRFFCSNMLFLSSAFLHAFPARGPRVTPIGTHQQKTIRPIVFARIAVSLPGAPRLRPARKSRPERAWIKPSSTSQRSAFAPPRAATAAMRFAFGPLHFPKLEAHAPARPVLPKLGETCTAPFPRLGFWQLLSP